MVAVVNPVVVVNVDYTLKDVACAEHVDVLRIDVDYRRIVVEHFGTKRGLYFSRGVHIADMVDVDFDFIVLHAEVGGIFFDYESADWRGKCVVLLLAEVDSHIVFVGLVIEFIHSLSEWAELNRSVAIVFGDELRTSVGGDVDKVDCDWEVLVVKEVGTQTIFHAVFNV